MWEYVPIVPYWPPPEGICIWSCLFVCLFVCTQDYLKNNERSCMQLSWVKNLYTYTECPLFFTVTSKRYFTALARQFSKSGELFTIGIATCTTRVDCTVIQKH